MARKKDKSQVNKNSSEISMIDRAVQNIFQILDPTYAGREAISAKDSHVRSILNRELEISNGVSGGSVVDFIASLQDKTMVNASHRNATQKEDIFTQNINEIFGYFEIVYQNKFLELKDLQFISKFIPSLGECVRTQLDSVVSSDTISDTINFSFKLPIGTTEAAKSAILDEIERTENKMKLRPKLKNIVYKKTLISGTHYVYAKPYRDIFKEYDRIKKKNESELSNREGSQFSSSNSHTPANETFMLGDIDIAPVMESATTLIGGASANKLRTQWSNTLSHFSCDTSEVLSEAIESASTIAGDPSAYQMFQNAQESGNKSGKNKKKKEDQTTFFGSQEMAVDPAKQSEVTPSDFDITGLYVKYINAHELIPIRIFDTTIAYARMQSQTRKSGGRSMNTSSMGIGQNLFKNLDVQANKQEAIINNLTDTIAEGIMNSFDKKFVSKNAEFKELIASCIIANGLTDKDFKIQVIPAEDIIPFRIQEGEDGYGVSMLADSLFPGKLLLSLIVSRMLNYINKTGNRTIAHVHKGPVGTMENNLIDRVIRDLQDGEVTFSDLLSPNLVFNKFNRNGNLQMPMSMSGNHLVELETQEGQTIDMDPEYEKKLEQMAIVGAGVPTGALDYETDPNFAQEIASSHIKYANRTGNYQGDLEVPTTILYRKAIGASSLNEDLRAIATTGLEVCLPRPRARTNENSSGYLRTCVELAEDVAKALIGQEKLQNAQDDKSIIARKDSLQREIIMDLAPFIDWDKYLKKLTDAETDVPDIVKDDASAGQY